MEINTSEEVCKGDNSYTLNTNPNPEVGYFFRMYCGMLSLGMVL